MELNRHNEISQPENPDSGKAKSFDRNAPGSESQTVGRALEKEASFHKDPEKTPEAKETPEKKEIGSPDKGSQYNSDNIKPSEQDFSDKSFRAIETSSGKSDGEVVSLPGNANVADKNASGCECLHGANSDRSAENGQYINQVDCSFSYDNVKTWDYVPKEETFEKYKSVFCNPQYFDQRTGEIQWPPNGGFDDATYTKTLEPGTGVDRFGSDFGTYVSPEGTGYGERSLPPGTDECPYSVFEVVKPIDVEAGIAAPWFDEPGGGVQYKFSKSIDDLLEEGYLRRINTDEC